MRIFLVKDKDEYCVEFEHLGDHTKIKMFENQTKKLIDETLNFTKI